MIIIKALLKWNKNIATINITIIDSSIKVLFKVSIAASIKEVLS